MLRSLWKYFFSVYTPGSNMLQKEQNTFFYRVTSKSNNGSSFTHKVYTYHVVRTTSRIQGATRSISAASQVWFSETRPVVPRDRSNNLGFLLICCRSCVLLKNYDCDTYSKPLMNSMYAQRKRWFQFLTCSHEFGWMDSEWQLRCDRPEPSHSASL